MDQVDLYYRRGPTQRIWLVLEVLFATGFSIALFVSVLSGWSPWNIWYFGLPAVIFGISVPVTRKRLADDRAKLSIIPQGIEDHRMKNPAVLLWKNIVSMYQDTGEGHRAVFKVSDTNLGDFTGPGTARHVLKGDRVTIELSDIEIEPHEFEALVKRFAPHVIKSWH